MNRQRGQRKRASLNATERKVCSQRPEPGNVSQFVVLYASPTRHHVFPPGYAVCRFRLRHRVVGNAHAVSARKYVAGTRLSPQDGRRPRNAR